MSFGRILCLANSYKHDNRCVAGINLVTKKWVRLVSAEIPGCLAQKQTCYADGKEAQVLDVFEAELGNPCGTDAHPEDVLVTSRPWQFLQHFQSPADVRFLMEHCNKRPTLIKSYSDRLYQRRSGPMLVEQSLDLIRPEDLWWWIREDKGKRKNRALFRIGAGRRTRYDLAVTDPPWLARMHRLPPGIYPHSKFFDGKTPDTFLTISLSEPFEGFHYKLVAGVVLLRV